MVSLVAIFCNIFHWLIDSVVHGEKLADAWYRSWKSKRRMEQKLMYSTHWNSFPYFLLHWMGDCQFNGRHTLLFYCAIYLQKQQIQQIIVQFVAHVMCCGALTIMEKPPAHLFWCAINFHNNHNHHHHHNHQHHPIYILYTSFTLLFTLCWQKINFSYIVYVCSHK